MNLSTKILGLITMLAAPFLLLEMCSDYKFGLAHTAAAGICDLIYMLGWACSILALLRMQAAGTKRWSERLLQVNLLFLGITCIWNVWEAIDPDNQSTLYRILDCFWPASNVLLFATGIVIAIQGHIRGLARFAPLLAGFWLIFAMAFGALAGGRNEVSFYVIGGYSAIAWFVLGLAVYLSNAHEKQENIAGA